MNVLRMVPNTFGMNAATPIKRTSSSLTPPRVVQLPGVSRGTSPGWHQALDHRISGQITRPVRSFIKVDLAMKTEHGPP
jgi:hypothetical protein